MFRRNGGRTITRYKKKGGTLKALQNFPFVVGRYKALEPAFDRTLGRVVYAVKYGSKTKKFYNAEKQALFMIRRQEEQDKQLKKDKKLYDHFEKERKEREKKKTSRKKKKNPNNEHERRLLDYLQNPGFDEMFEEDYDVVPNPRRRR